MRAVNGHDGHIYEQEREEGYLYGAEGFWIVLQTELGMIRGKRSLLKRDC